MLQLCPASDHTVLVGGQNPDSLKEFFVPENILPRGDVELHGGLYQTAFLVPNRKIPLLTLTGLRSLHATGEIDHTDALCDVKIASLWVKTDSGEDRHFVFDQKHAVAQCPPKASQQVFNLVDPQLVNAVKGVLTLEFDRELGYCIVSGQGSERVIGYDVLVERGNPNRRPVNLTANTDNSVFDGTGKCLDNVEASPDATKFYVIPLRTYAEGIGQHELLCSMFGHPQTEVHGLELAVEIRGDTVRSMHSSIRPSVGVLNNDLLAHGTIMENWVMTKLNVTKADRRSWTADLLFVEVARDGYVVDAWYLRWAEPTSLVVPRRTGTVNHPIEIQLGGELWRGPTVQEVAIRVWDALPNFDLEAAHEANEVLHRESVNDIHGQVPKMYQIR